MHRGQNIVRIAHKNAQNTNIGFFSIPFVCQIQHVCFCFICTVSDIVSSIAKLVIYMGSLVPHFLIVFVEREVEVA